MIPSSYTAFVSLRKALTLCIISVLLLSCYTIIGHVSLVQTGNECAITEHRRAGSTAHSGDTPDNGATLIAFKSIFYSVSEARERRQRDQHVSFVWQLLSLSTRGRGHYLFTGSESKVRLQPGEHRQDEVPKRGVLSDEEAGRVDVSVLQGGLLLGGDVLLLRAVPHLLQAGSGRQRDVSPGAVHGLALHQPPLLFVQLRQYGHPRLVLKAWYWRVSSHVKPAQLAEKIKVTQVHEADFFLRYVLIQLTSV